MKLPIGNLLDGEKNLEEPDWVSLGFGWQVLLVVLLPYRVTQW